LPIPVILDLPGATDHDLYPYALAQSAIAGAARGELDHVERSCQEALQASRRLSSEHERLEVEYLIAMAQSVRLFALGQWREAAGYSEQAAGIARGDGREASAAGNLASAANCYTMAGDPQAAVEIAKKALEMSRAAGGSVAVAFCLVVLAGALAEAEPLQARSMLEEGLALRLRQQRSEGEAMDSDQAAAYALEAIRRARQSTAV
jgi:tetratricopeptide (TPR) repeat protein